MCGPIRDSNFNAARIDSNNSQLLGRLLGWVLGGALGKLLGMLLGEALGYWNVPIIT